MRYNFAQSFEGIVMSKSKLTLAFLSSTLLAASVFAADRKLVNLDLEQSKVEWTGEKLTGSHTGNVNLKSGQAIIEDGKLVGGKFEIGMDTIVDKDLTDSNDNAKLTKHLKSDDFFGVQSFPVTTFTITKATEIAGSKAGEANYNIAGDLTIKGITLPISFPARVEITDTTAMASAALEVDRTKYNVRYGSGKFFENLGDKLIYDNFKINLDLKGAVGAG